MRAPEMCLAKGHFGSFCLEIVSVKKLCAYIVIVSGMRLCTNPQGKLCILAQCIRRAMEIVTAWHHMVSCNSKSLV